MARCCADVAVSDLSDESASQTLEISLGEGLLAELRKILSVDAHLSPPWIAIRGPRADLEQLLRSKLQGV